MNQSKRNKRERKEEEAAEPSLPRPAQLAQPSLACPFMRVAHEAGPATPYRPRAHKPLTSQTRPSAVTHRTPPHQDKLTNGPPLSATQLQRRRLPHAPSTTRPGADHGAGAGLGSRKSHDPVFPLRRAYATVREPSDALGASPPPDHRPPSEPLELGYKSQRS